MVQRFPRFAEFFYLVKYIVFTMPHAKLLNGMLLELNRFARIDNPYALASSGLALEARRRHGLSNTVSPGENK